MWHAHFYWAALSEASRIESKDIPISGPQLLPADGGSCAPSLSTMFRSEIQQSPIGLEGCLADPRAAATSYDSDVARHAGGSTCELGFPKGCGTDAIDG